MKKVTVLGSGIVGGLIAKELSRSFEVTCADMNSSRLEQLFSNTCVKIIQCDLSERNQIIKAVSTADLAVLALPGFMGYNTLRTLIENRTNTVDISFFEEDPFSLDELARKQGISALIDCGIAPGLCNIILGHHIGLGKVRSYKCLVGGLVRARFLPFEYKSVFSPSDVIAEYVREARIVENGEIRIKPALSEPELVDFEGVGTLVAFNTDGLRTLIKTADVPFMTEKTLRYPGTYEYLKVLKDTGFFSDKPVHIKGVNLKPCDFSEVLLSENWRITEKDRDITCMKITVENNPGSIYASHEYYLFDSFDENSRELSMARTTGFTCCAVCMLFLEGKIKERGVLAPEFIGRDEGCFSFILDFLREKGVQISVKNI
ncbi:saccharopine dehydrogenase NADP-binding domain-containing protein [candidate division WOR-3 bacterium]|nr:saccharopine dehydrogenase NADP-binding domain-containing protein [candidate division WOR-3 bacterium]